MTDRAAWVHYGDINPWDGNPNIHPQFQPELIAESIRTFGFVAPVVIWPAKNRLVAGHGRLQAMRLIVETGYSYLDAAGRPQHRPAEPGFVAHGASEAGAVRVIYHDFPSEAAANAYALADNEIAKRAIWDDEKVAELIRSLEQDESFAALHAIGFPQAELEAMLHELPPEPVGAPPPITAPDPGPSPSGSAEPSNKTATLVDLVIPMSVAERARCHGAINLAKRITGVQTTREAMLAIVAAYERDHAGAPEATP